MKFKTCIILLVVFIFAQLLLAQNKINPSVVASGGGTSSNATQRIVGTIGQPIIGLSSNNTQQAQSGFWNKYIFLPTSVEQLGDLVPKEFQLEQNYPNPFNPSTTIQFSVPKISKVKVKIYDILGREITTLVDEQYLPGVYKIVFEAGELPTGMYIYRIQAGDFREAKKFLLLK